jgi:hypothetical protein
MNKFRHLMNALAVVVFTLMVTSLAQAQATRTWVSGVGDDANPCSRTAPCKTFAGAISKTAKDGEIDALDPGGFGAVTITKSITIDGQGTLASILAAGTNGVNVNVTDAADVRKTVRLRNISINGAASGVHGINATAFSKLFVQNCQIAGFQSSGTSRGIKIALAASGGQAFIKDTLLSSNSSGIDVSTTSGGVVAVLDHVNLEGMTDGLTLGAGASATLRDSFVVLNSGVGVKLSTSGAAASIERTVLNHNGTGLQPGAGTTTDLSNVTMVGNSTGIAATGGTVQSHNNNQFNLNAVPGPAPGGIGQQ